MSLWPESLGYMLAPLVVCAVITCLLTYFGVHILQREVIFVDLALAQIAALGATYAFYLGLDPGGNPAYLYSLGFATFGAVLFSLTRHRHSRVPQEAIIGIAYAVASGAAILLVDLARDPHGSEKIQYLLVGNLVWVTWPEVAKTSGLCLIVGLFHYFLRRPFLLVTFQESEAARLGYSVRWWDFLFYFTFGLAITGIVHVTGVLLVFSFLIIPAAVGTLYAQGIARRILIGWAVGLGVSFFGLLFSYNRPSGPTIVTLFGLCLLFFGSLRFVLSSPAKGRAVAVVSGGIGAFLFLILGLPMLTGHGPDEHHHANAELHQHTDSTSVPTKSSGPTAQPTSLEGWIDQLDSLNSVLREKAIDYLGGLDQPRALDALAKALQAETDEGLKLKLAVTLYHHDRKEAGLHGLMDLLEHSRIPFVRMEALEHLHEFSGETFGYEPLKSPEENQAAIRRWQQWMGQR